jgi:hypothetical protein
MTMKTISVPTVKHGPMEIRGEECGPFLIHKPLLDIGLGEWHVTHCKTGMKFPCSFVTKGDARKFVIEVQSIMDFGDVDCALAPNRTVKAIWVKGEPTAKQKEEVRKLMERLGA